MQLSITTCISELSLTCSPFKEEVVSLITSAKISAKIYDSIYDIRWNSDLIVCINYESVIPQVEYLNNQGWHCFGAYV